MLQIGADFDCTVCTTLPASQESKNRDPQPPWLEENMIHFSNSGSNFILQDCGCVVCTSAGFFEYFCIITNITNYKAIGLALLYLSNRPVK